MMYPYPRSRLWYLLPIFLGLLGGLAAWFVLRNSDRVLARNCLLAGIASSAVSVAVSLLYAGFPAVQDDVVPWDG